MKQNDINSNDVIKLVAQNLENLFNIYPDEDGTYFYNILKTVNFPKDLQPSIYSVYSTLPGDTWPLIAWKHYKDVKLWWIVCMVNNINNPIELPTPGTLLKILDTNVVREVLSEINGV